MVKFKNFLEKILMSTSRDLLSLRIEGIILEIVKTRYAKGEDTVSYSELIKQTQTASRYSLELAIRNLSSKNILSNKDGNNLTITDKANEEFEKRKNDGTLF
jgi:DNA-binding FadR family transcriptional regulator